MIRRLTLTEEQFNAVMEALEAWDVYATIKSDDCVDPDDLNTVLDENYPDLKGEARDAKYEELEQAEVDRHRDMGSAMKEVLDEMTEMCKQKLEPVDKLTEELYFKYRDKIDRDWSTVGMWMMEGIPNTSGEIEEEILQAEYGLTSEQIDDLEYQEPDDIPYDDTWDFKRSVVTAVVEEMCKDGIH